MSRRGARRARAVAPPEPSSDFLGSRLRPFGVAVVCAKLALVPVVFDHDSDVPFSVIKALLGHALAYVLAGVLLGLIVRYGRSVSVWSWLHIPVLAFLAVNVAAALFALDPLLALYGAHTRMVGLGTIADCALLYFAIAFLVRTRTDVLAVAVSVLAGCTIVLAYEFIQLIGKDPLNWSLDPSTRPFSTIGQTNNLAEYLTVITVGGVAVALFQKELPFGARAFLILFSGLAIAGTVVTQTRSAIFGWVVGWALLVALTWAVHPDPRARVTSVVGSVGAAAVFAAVLLVTPLGVRLLSTVETSAAIEGETGLSLETAADARVAIYRIALEMVKDRPVFGQGPDNFLASLPRFRSDAEPYGVQDDATTSAHGWLAQVAATSGVTGLVAFVSIGLTALVLTFRSGFRPEAWAAVGMLGAFLGTGATTVNAIATDWLFWAAAGTVAATTAPHMLRRLDAAATATAGSSRRAKTAPAASSSGMRSAIGYACVAIGLAVALTTVSAIDASRSAKASQVARLRGQNQLAIDFGLRATRSDSQRPQYWDTLGLAYISSDRLSDALSAFEHAAKLAPYDVRYDGDLARAFAALVLKGDGASAARARGVAERVVQTDPNNPLAHQTRAVVMQVTGNLPEALRSSERAVLLDRTSEVGYTRNPEIFVTGVQLLTANGRPLDAIALARTAIPKEPDPRSTALIKVELARALMASGQLTEALVEIDGALAIQPANVTAQQLRAQILEALRR